jgi:hypothetical protein
VIDIAIFLLIPNSNKIPTIANSTAPRPAGVIGNAVRSDEAKVMNTTSINGRDKSKDLITKNKRNASRTQIRAVYSNNKGIFLIDLKVPTSNFI